MRKRRWFPPSFYIFQRADDVLAEQLQVVIGCVGWGRPSLAWTGRMWGLNCLIGTAVALLGLARWGRMVCCAMGCLVLRGMVVVGAVGAWTEHSPIAFVVETPRHRPKTRPSDAPIAPKQHSVGSEFNSNAYRHRRPRGHSTAGHRSSSVPSQPNCAASGTKFAYDTEHCCDRLKQ